MTLLHVVDAFTDQPFSGNPAAVCVLQSAADEKWMRKVALEMNLAETAFLWPVEGGYSLRWFTPTVEVDLCGHATLASAFVLWKTLVASANQELRFLTRSGWLCCTQRNEWIEMDFPLLKTERCEIPTSLRNAIGWQPDQLFKSSMDYLVEVADEATLRDLKIQMNVLASLPARGLIVTCRSESTEFDFVSRFFAPAAGVNEDPVTGSAHCALGPYWKAKLQKSTLKAYQASPRGGVVHMQVEDDRVTLIGQAIMMSRVELLIQAESI